MIVDPTRTCFAGHDPPRPYRLPRQVGPGPVRDVRWGWGIEHHEIAGGPGREGAVALHAQGERSAPGGGMYRLLGGEPHLHDREADHRTHRLEVGGPRVAVGGQGDGDAVLDQHGAWCLGCSQHVRGTGDQDGDDARVGEGDGVALGYVIEMIGAHGPDLGSQCRSAGMGQLLGVDPCAQCRDLRRR